MPTFNDLYYPQVGCVTSTRDAEQFNIGITQAFYSEKQLKQLLLQPIYFLIHKNKIIATLQVISINGLCLMLVGFINGADLFGSLATLTVLLHTINYTWQHASDRTYHNQANYDHQIAYTPRHSGSAHATLELNQLQISYTLIWSGIRYNNNYNDTSYRMNGYADHGLSIMKSFPTCLGKITLSGEALNLGNKNYEIVKNYPMPGRSYRFTLVFHF